MVAAYAILDLDGTNELVVPTGDPALAGGPAVVCILPALGDDGVFLDGFDLPDFAAFILLEDSRGRQRLAKAAGAEGDVG